MAVESTSTEAIEQAVDDVTGYSVSKGDINPEDLGAFERGDKEQKYHVNVQDLESNSRGQVIVELTDMGDVWKAEVVRKVGI